MQRVKTPAASPLTAADAAAAPDPDAAPAPDPDVAPALDPDAAPATATRRPPRKIRRPKPQYGILRVGTAPYRGKQTWGTVFLDGVKIGGTPLHRRVRAGYHVVEVRQGALRKRRRVRVRAGRKNNFTFKLR